MKDAEGIVLPAVAGIDHVFHQFTLRVLDGQRDGFQRHLSKSGIGSMVYYPVPLHKMNVFKERCVNFGTLKHAERAAGEVLSLPVEPLQDDNIGVYITQCVKDFFD